MHGTLVFDFHKGFSKIFDCCLNQNIPKQTRLIQNRSIEKGILMWVTEKQGPFDTESVPIK
jgi:hypothetical protein